MCLWNGYLLYFGSLFFAMHKKYPTQPFSRAHLLDMEKNLLLWVFQIISKINTFWLINSRFSALTVKPSGYFWNHCNRYAKNVNFILRCFQRQKTHPKIQNISQKQKSRQYLTFQFTYSAKNVYFQVHIYCSSYHIDEYSAKLGLES